MIFNHDSSISFNRINIHEINQFNVSYLIDKKEKQLYYDQCRFNFNPFLYPQIKGYELLYQFQFYHSVNNKNGLQRDHMISKDYGWRNNIDPKIISHPANCELLLAIDNLRKRTDCSITLEELMYRIENWNNLSLDNSPRYISGYISMSARARNLIADSVRNMRWYTDGIKNVKQHKDLDIPIGFKPGMTTDLIMYTDGIVNIKQSKDLVVPPGFRRGFTIKKSNKLRYTDGITNISIEKDMLVPDGFYRGVTAKGGNYIYYTDGIVTTKQDPSLPAPDGFYRGVTKKKQELVWYTDGVTNIYQNKNLSAPEGFRLGQTKKKIKYAFYTNGIINIKQSKNLPAPEGFRIGMTKKERGK